MTRQASQRSSERVPGFISRIASTSSLLQPYVPGRRTASTHPSALHSRGSRSSGEDISLNELASLLAQLAGTPTLEASLTLLARRLPAALNLARIVVALDKPASTVDSRTIAAADSSEPTSSDSPITVARVTNPLWLVPRQPAVTGDVVEVPVEVGGERFGLLRAWRFPDDARPPDPLLSALRMLSTALGQHVLLLRARGALPATPDTSRTLTTLGEQRRWNEFLTYVAHDLKTPLTCIQGHAQLLSRYVRAARAKTTAKSGAFVRLLDDCERHLPALEKQVARIDQLLRDTLDLARSDEGSLTLTRVPANLTELLRRAGRGVEAEHSRAIAIEAPPLVEVRCDTTRIERVFGELISYVVRSGGGERDVRVQVTETNDGNAHVARIAIGYAQPAPPAGMRAFDSSAQFGTESAASPLDLRLAVGAAILRQHGGSLRYLPDEAGGSQLLLVLPALETLSAQQGEIHGAPDSHRG